MVSTTNAGSANMPAAWIPSERMSRCSSSPLRDIFSAIEQPGVISFAGGLPDESLFPDLAGIFQNIASPDTGTGCESTAICQYGASNGENYLRQWAADYSKANGLSVSPDQIIILSGSQQGIDLCAKLLIDRGTGMSVVYPTYLAALQSFSLFGAHYHELKAGVDGKYPLQNSSVAYVNPTFSNPNSSNLTLQQRKNLASSCDKTATVLIEDDAYRELFYEECERQPVCSFLQRAEWVYLSSFSKTIAPGLRIGFMAVSEELLPYMIRLKQAADLHSSRLAQHLIIKLLQQGEHQQRLEHLREHYRKKRDSFHENLSDNWSDICEWECPSGGMFFWLKLKQPLTVSLPSVLQEAITQGVAFMPGEYFYPAQMPLSIEAASQQSVISTGNAFTEQSTSENSLRPHQPGQMIRLNFTNASSADASAGLQTLAALLRRYVVDSQTPR